MLEDPIPGQGGSSATFRKTPPRTPGHDRPRLPDFLPRKFAASAAMPARQAVHRAVEMCFLEGVLHQSRGHTSPKATAIAPASRNPLSTTPKFSFSTNRPTAWTRTRNTKSGRSSAKWARPKRSSFPPTFSKKWRRCVREPSSSTGARSWPIARRNNSVQKSEWAGAVTMRVNGVTAAALNQKLSAALHRETKSSSSRKSQPSRHGPRFSRKTAQRRPRRRASRMPRKALARRGTPHRRGAAR